MHLQVTALN